jgi:hypothetical protein
VIRVSITSEETRGWPFAIYMKKVSKYLKAREEEEL